MEPASPLPQTNDAGSLMVAAGLRLPLRGGTKAEGRALSGLVAALRRAEVQDVRLLGLVAQPGPLAIQRAHLLAGLAAMVLSLLWPAGGLALLLVLTASSLSRCLGGPGLRLALARPAWNLVVQPERRRAERIVVVAMDRRRSSPLAERLSTGGLSLACLVPAFPEIFPEVGLVMLLLVVALGWADRPFPPEAQGPEHEGLAALLGLAWRPPLHTWLVASGAGAQGLEAVLDWWNLDGKVEILQVGGDVSLHPRARRLTPSEAGQL